jgi:hypothetical protein
MGEGSTVDKRDPVYEMAVYGKVGKIFTKVSRWMT